MRWRGLREYQAYLLMTDKNPINEGNTPLIPLKQFSEEHGIAVEWFTYE